MELHSGRPTDTTGRLEKELRCYDLLDGLGVEYQRVDHAPAMTMEVCQEIDRVLHAVICKNLFLCNRQETAFYLLMIPDTKVFHTKDLSAQIGAARLSFAKAEYMQAFGYYAGVGQRTGPDERHRPQGAAADRRGCAGE